MPPHRGRASWDQTGEPTNWVSPTGAPRRGSALKPPSNHRSGKCPFGRVGDCFAPDRFSTMFVIKKIVGSTLFVVINIKVFLFVCHRVEIHVAGFRTKSSSNSPSQGAQQPSYLFPSARIVRRGFPKHTARPGTRGTSLVLLVYSHFGMGGKSCLSHVPLCLHCTRPCTHTIDFF